MTTEAFACLSLASALAVLLVTELGVPFGPLRRFLMQGRRVAYPPGEENCGPWYITDPCGKEPPDNGPTFTSPHKAAAALPLMDRFRAWGSELVSCVWCSGAYCAAFLLGCYSLGPAPVSVLWFWLPVWFVGSALAVVMEAVADR